MRLMLLLILWHLPIAQAQLPLSNRFQENFLEIFIWESCQSGSYFVTCFQSINEKSCASKLRVIAKSCGPVKDSENWSQAYNWGHCVGETIEKNEAHNKRSDLKCHELNGWIE